MTEAAARAHVARFNTAVTSGDWAPFLDALHPHAIMTFVGRAVGPQRGRDAIAIAYAEQPPDDTIRVNGIRSDGDRDVITFAWSRGGTGTLTLGYSGGRVAELIVQFD
ncbi:nuclear transport factor 2 family protein [Micromonospora sp. MA102]|uniref:nuclear transport factor 2 family protein n=1 Tax=Micromonospora sp. MA102 TaxID=2952755 RepID=UPI0021C56C83|nr:nuclear transport factor 2 family protein [Micromonospora sp. MA102]